MPNPHEFEHTGVYGYRLVMFGHPSAPPHAVVHRRAGGWGSSGLVRHGSSGKDGAVPPPQTHGLLDVRDTRNDALSPPCQFRDTGSVEREIAEPSSLIAIKFSCYENSTWRTPFGDSQLPPPPSGRFNYIADLLRQSEANVPLPSLGPNRVFTSTYNEHSRPISARYPRRRLARMVAISPKHVINTSDSS
jgi:hypothetical protein